MRTDGAVWDGPMPHELGNFELHMNSHLYEGSEFPDGTHHGLAVMHIESHTNSYMDGRFAGSGDAGRFALTRSAMWDRPASLDSAAGTYTRSDSSGYAMSMTISANGQLSGSDSRGCQFTGTVHVPDPAHNLFRMETEVSSCGTFDGHYEGMGTLVDADAMQDWMSRMMPFQHGHHAGGGHMGGQVTVPGGQRNLFMFVLANENNALMDALAK